MLPSTRFSSKEPIGQSTGLKDGSVFLRFSSRSQVKVQQRSCSPIMASDAKWAGSATTSVLRTPCMKGLFWKALHSVQNCAEHCRTISTKRKLVGTRALSSWRILVSIHLGCLPFAKTGQGILQASTAPRRVAAGARSLRLLEAELSIEGRHRHGRCGSGLRRAITEAARRRGDARETPQTGSHALKSDLTF